MEILQIKQFKQETNLLVALGNIGKEYINTRHNIGFMFADIFEKFLDDQGIDKTKKVNNVYSVLSFKAINFSILKPQTYMNQSGKALSDYLYNNSLKNIEGFQNRIVVVHDDLDIKLGSYKLQMGKSPRQHNGIISIEQHLANAKNTFRLRIGVENREDSSRIQGANYVLSRFTQDELFQLKELFYNIIENEFIF